MAKADWESFKNYWVWAIRDTLMNKPWGGSKSDMYANNYYAGYFRNEINLGLILKADGDPRGQPLLDKTLAERWDNGLVPYFKGDGAGGVPLEGNQYGGRYMLQYTTLAFRALRNATDRNLYRETKFYPDSIRYLIYSALPASMRAQGGPELYSLNQQQNLSWNFLSGSSYYKDFVMAIKEAFGGDPADPNYHVAQEAQLLEDQMTVTGSSFLEATDKAIPAAKLDQLPLDYYAPGAQFLYSHSSWDPAKDVSVFVHGGDEWLHTGHRQLAAGTFEMKSGNEWLLRNPGGYSSIFPGQGGVGTVDDQATVVHNGAILVGDPKGPYSTGLSNAYQDGPARVTRFQSGDFGSFLSVNLSDDYKSSTSNYPFRDHNPYVKDVIRNYAFFKDLGFVTVDWVNSTNPSDLKTFTINTLNKPTVNNGILETIVGDQRLRVTTFERPGVTHTTQTLFGGSVGDSSVTPVWRTEDNYVNNDGSTGTFIVHAFQGGSASGEMIVDASLTEDATTITVTLRERKTGRTGVLTLNKEMNNVQGSIGSGSGTPTLQPLYNGIQETP